MDSTEIAPTQAKKFKKKIAVGVRPRDIKNIQTIIDKSVADYIKALPDKIDKILNDATIAALGFEHDSSYYGSKNKWRVAQNGHGLISRFFTDRLETTVKRFFKTLEPDWAREFRDVTRKDFTDKVKECIKQELHDQARNYAKTTIDKMVSKFGAIELTNMSPLDEKQAANPKLGQTELEKLLLEQLIEKHGTNPQEQG